MQTLRNYIETLKLFTGNARLFLLGSFAMGIGQGVYWVLFNLYLRELGIGEARIGDVLSASALGFLLASLPSAYLLDIFPMRRVLAASAFLACLGSLGMVFFPGGAALPLAAGFTGMMVTVHQVAAAPLFMKNSGPRERIHLFGASFAVEIFAAVLGTWASGRLASVLTFGSGPAAGLRAALALAAGFVALAAIPYGRIGGAATGIAAGRQDIRRYVVPRDPGLLFKLCFPRMLTGMGAGLIIPFLNLYFRDVFRASTASIGTYFAGSQLLTMAGFLLAPVVARRFGMVRVIVLSEMLSIPFFLILAFTTNLPLAIIAFLFRSALMNLAVPIFNMFSMEAVPEEEHTTTNSLLGISWNISWVLSTRVGGRLIEGHSYTLPMLLTVALYLLSSLLYLLYFHDFERKRALPPATRPGEPAPVEVRE
jgi:MFS family permease